MQLWKTEVACAAHALRSEGTVRRLLVTSSCGQRRTNQGLVVIQMFPCSLIGKLTAGSVLLLRMALTAAMGKYNKQGYLSIASANANLSNKKVWLQRISRAHPGFFPPTLLSSSNHLPLCLLWFIPACKGQGESLLRLNEGWRRAWSFLVSISQLSASSWAYHWAVCMRSSEALF